MASENVVAGQIRKALEDDEVRKLFGDLMQRCREYEDIKGIKYRDAVMEQIAGSVGSLLKKGGKERSDETNVNANNTNIQLDVHGNKDLDSASIAFFKGDNKNIQPSSYDTIDYCPAEEQEALCQKIISALKMPTDDDLAQYNLATQEDRIWNDTQAEFLSFLKAHGYELPGKPIKTEPCISGSILENAATDLIPGFHDEKPSRQTDTEESDVAYHSNDEDYKSTVDQMDRFNKDDYQSTSENDDRDSWYSNEDCSLSRTSSAGFITASNSVEHIAARREMHDKTMRSQFVGHLYLKNRANARETAAEIQARKPASRVNIEKPVRLDTNLMYTVRQSLRRSLPKVAGNNNLSALMIMADGMFDEMSLDRDLDDLAWPIDPLAELRASGLALVDYMDSAYTVNDETKINVIASGELKSEPMISVNRFRELFDKILIMPQIPGMTIRSTSCPNANHDVNTVNESTKLSQHSEPPVQSSAINAGNKSPQKLSTNLEVIANQVTNEARIECCKARNIRPQFGGEFYVKNIINAVQTAAEVNVRKSWPESKIDKLDERCAALESLKRSLPKTAGKNELSALTMMADRIFDEVQQSGDIDDVTLPIDPLAELKASGLASVDYMDPHNVEFNLECPTTTDIDGENPSSKVMQARGTECFKGEYAEENSVSHGDQGVSQDEDIYGFVEKVENHAVDDPLALCAASNEIQETECHHRELVSEALPSQSLLHPKDEDSLSEDSSLYGEENHQHH